MKRCLTLLLIVLLCLLPAAVFAENLLQNGGFEQVDEAGRPVDWTENAYRTQTGYSRMGLSQEKVHSGQYSAVVENASGNDARLICTVQVEPSSLYRLSGYVLVDHMEDTGNGANFGLEGLYAFSECLFDTEGDWKYLEWYGETGPSQTELTFGVRVGGYSAESVGKAYFDDIALEKVEELPTGVFADLWYYESTPVQEEEPDEPQKHTLMFVVLALAFALLCVIGYYACSHLGAKAGTVLLCMALAAAAGLRVYLGLNVSGYQVDMNCFTAWSLRMASNGPAGFYAADYFCDYPPGFLLLIWPVGLLLNAIGYGSTFAPLVVKLLPILCDLAGALVLYRFAKKRDLSNNSSALLAAAYLLNPAVLVNGAAWGQVDSVLALMLLITVILALNHRWQAALPVFICAILVKPQALLYAPLGLAWLILCLIRSGDDRKRQLKKVGWGVWASVLAALVIILPFSLRQENPFGWLIELYSDTLSSYPYATLNTANLYYLLGANWVSLTEAAPGLLTGLLAALFAVLAICLLWKKRKEQLALGVFLLISAAVMALLCLLGASYSYVGYAMMAFSFAFAILCLIRDRARGQLPFCMALALMGIYVLGVKVHERYLFTALILLLVCYVLSRDWRVLSLYVGFSITTFINTAIVLDNSILFGAEQGHLNMDTLAINDALCLLNLLLMAFAFWVGFTGLKEQRLAPIRAPRPAQTLQWENRYRRLLDKPRDARLRLGWKDYAIMGVVTVLYGALAFTNLGSTVAPQTAWISTSAQEQVVMDLGENQEFQVLYYAGVSYYDFSISVSEDGENWSDPYPCEMREGLCYRWLYAVQSTQEEGSSPSYSSVPLTLNGRYLRLNAEEAGLNLWEIVARDTDGNNIPLTVISHTGAKREMLDEPQLPEHLVDEADTCIGEPSWYNGTYFDEIYHARTAYEHLHGQRPYETTHPPLGKLMMAVGIVIFGMTPFGWRFAGTLIGVLMLPALYLLARQLTHKRSIASLSMIAFSLDLMHYTQTRIATIDSFPVFFILLSYLFMVRYMQTDVFAAEENPRLMSRSFLRTLIPLLLSGLCMGLSIASKWIGMYSAVGLALLFFITIYRQWRVSYLASGEEESTLDGRGLIARQFTLKRILITCLFCVGFFILIPCVIYYLCYIPYLSPSGPVTIKRVIDAQIGMLNYHSTPGLGMDHPFQSPWWQWPFILKPMWFAQDKYEPAGYASTIMCMGNPWIFYVGALAMAAVLVVFLCRMVKPRFACSIDVDEDDQGMTVMVVCIGFLAQYLPWVLVPRSMYIYHYFASVPFIILSTALCIRWLGKANRWIRYGLMAALLIAVEALLLTKMDAPLWPMLLLDAAVACLIWLSERKGNGFMAKHGLTILYVLFAALFFVMFFPYASGWLTATDQLEAVRWFSKLYY